VKQRILQMPHPTLRQVAAPFPDQYAGWTEEHAAVLKDLRDTFAETDNCIGLAANQIGQLWRAIVVDVTPKRTEPYVMVNPVIVKASEDLQLVNDGCMSIFEGKRHTATKRPKRITVEWLDPRTLEPLKQKFTGLLAACIHHEIDHLNGVLFVDRVV
jgi:peptide deformylase